MTNIVSSTDLHALARNAELVFNRESGDSGMLQLKCPPISSAAELANLCGIDRNAFEARRRIADLPDGHMTENKRRLFTTNESHTWIRDARNASLRPNFAVPANNWSPPGAVICMAGLTPGSGKTTAALTLAQGLNLRGQGL